MGAISDFVAAFTRDYEKYLVIEKEVRALCEEALRDIQFLWQSRVKAVESLEKKLRDRSESYKGESENVADIVDLVGGRIILADWRDFERVEEIVRNKFNFRGRVQHPKPGQKSVNSQSRFRGYGGRHFHVTRESATGQHSCNPVIEIQVMTAYMWAYATLAHDIEYKQLRGEPSKDLVLSLEMLKGIANLGEIGLDMFNQHFLPVARVSPQQNDISLNLPSAIETAGASVWLDENERQCLRDLRLTDPRHDKERIEASKDKLLEGSCSWVLDDPAFVKWWTCDDSRLLWIHGDPGKGKTMMMIALISEVSKKLNDRHGPNVLAYFFCQNTSSDLNTTVSVLRGLIYLLVDQEKKLVRHIRRHYDTAGTQLFKGTNAAYALRMILSGMLKDESLGNVFIMIDALDECDAKIHELLDWIVRQEPGMLPKVKWLMTSRNEPAFIERLGHGRQLHTSLELNSMHVARAVTSFIDYKVKELADMKSYGRNLQVFVRRSLIHKAEDTFLWVALVCKELSKIRQQKVRSLLEKMPAGLIPLYERMLKQVLHHEDQNDVELSRRVLCSVTLALRPLRLEEIAVFAEVPSDEDIEELVGLCGSFLTIREETVYLVHQSVKDYLSDGERKEIFLLGKEHEHANTASLCLRTMSNLLRKDICNLQKPGFRLSEVETCSIGAHLPFHAQYACLHWANHLQQAGSNMEETLTLGEDCQVVRFFEDQFLHWLEALVLMSKYSEAVFAVGLLGSIQRSQMSASLISLIKDAERFVVEFRPVLETAPLQVYISALVFSPEISIVKRVYSNELPKWIERLPSVEKAWPVSLQTLESDSYMVTEVMFSPDRKLLVAAYESNDVFKIWDMSAGALRGTLEISDSPRPVFKTAEPPTFKAMKFQSNGQLLASAAYNLDFRIWIWDPVTGITQDILEDRQYQIAALALSPDGRFLASASRETKNIKLWDPLTGTVRANLEGHIGLVKVITFASPNGQVLASGSEDATIKLWNSSTGACRHTLKAHSGPISAVTFSPCEGQLLASVADGDLAIRLWDTSTGALKVTLQGHSKGPRSIVFSPDGQLLVAISRDDTISIWDSATGASKGIIEGIHADLQVTENISFSPDGRSLAIPSSETVQLWDPVTRILQGTLKGHTDEIRAIKFSTDGHLLATGSFDQTIRLWDTAAEPSQDKLESHSGMIRAIKFSPCGRLVASASVEEIVLWDSATGAFRCRFDFPLSMCEAIAFSPSSQLLASAHTDGFIRLWDPVTEASRLELEVSEEEITAVAFSADGQILALGFQNGTIMFLDPDTGAARGTLKNTSSSRSVDSLAFSPDGQTLASMSYNSSIELWVISTCTSRGTLEVPSPSVETLIFSPDSQLLASGNFTTVNVWNLKEGTLIHQNEHYRGGNLSFDEKGTQLEVSGRLVQISSSLDEPVDAGVWSTAPYAINKRKEWVTYKDCNVLKLPLSRKPEEYAVHGNTMVLGSTAGYVTFFHFANAAAPPCT